MPYRFLVTAVVLACMSSIHFSYAQQITSDVLVSWIGIQDGSASFMCDTQGQAYRVPTIDGHSDNSVMRVARDGSTLLFRLPDPWLRVYASANPGLAVLSSASGRLDDSASVMYRFDEHGSLVTRRPVSIDFRAMAMAVTSSGKAIVVGYRPQSGATKESRKYVGAILDVSDQIDQRFEFPAGTDGDIWTPGGRMEGGDGVAYLILKSGAGPIYSIATISESGHFDIANTAVPPDSDTRHHNEWLFGPGIAVEVYHFPGEKRVIFRFGEYDITSGKKLRTKTTLPAGFAMPCYFGDEISMMALRGHGEQRTTHLVTVKLEQ